jgi:hypothetical protein
MTNKTYFYIRVSTTQQGRSGLGIEAQRRALQHFAQTEGIEVLGEYVEVETGKGADAHGNPFGRQGTWGHLGNPKLHVARKNAVEAVRSEADRLRCQCAPKHPRGPEGRRAYPRGDCGGAQRTRHRHGARRPMVRLECREHP